MTHWFWLSKTEELNSWDKKRSFWVVLLLCKGVLMFGCLYGWNKLNKRTVIQQKEESCTLFTLKQTRNSANTEWCTLSKSCQILHKFSITTVYENSTRPDLQQVNDLEGHWRSSAILTAIYNFLFVVYSNKVSISLKHYRLILTCMQWHVDSEYRGRLSHAGKQKYAVYLHTHTYPFNGPLAGSIRVSQYQKGKTNLDFTEARDS